MTWGELAEEIASLPSEMQGQQARIWLPHDFEWTEFPEVVGISAFDAERPYSVSNFASIDLKEA